MVMDDAIPEGYQQTEVGVIPEDWKLLPLSDLFNFATGKLNSEAGKVDGEYPFFTCSQITAKIDTYSFDQRALILTGNNAKGVYSIKYYDGKFDAYQRTYILSVHHNRDTNYHYLKYSLARILELLQKSSYGSATKYLTLGILKPIRIQLPSSHEQNVIARTLSETDALITSLDNLIAKKRNIKQGTIQQFLTGKRRLPGFTEEWEEKKLMEMIQIPVTDGPHLTPDFLPDGIPFLSVNNLVNNRIDFSELRYISQEDQEVFSIKCKPKMNDILLGKAASVGKVAIVDFNIEFNIWSPIALIRIKKRYIPKFYYYYFQSHSIMKQIEFFTNSSSQGNIGMGDIEKLKFPVPLRDEQTAIATVLSDIDAEITALEQRREKVKAIKQGMMQELLTGKTRLV